MKRIAIVGIGNIGLRHLESVFNNEIKNKIYAIDKSKN